MVELEQFLEHPDAALESLVASLAKGNLQAELWDALHRAAQRDRREPDLAFAYEQVTLERRVRQLAVDAQVELLERAAVFFGAFFGDLDTAVNHAERALALAPARTENAVRLEDWLRTQARLARLGRVHVVLAKAESDPSLVQGHLDQAFDYAREEQIDAAGAVEVLEQILQIAPERSVVAEILEEKLLLAGRFRDAAKRMEARLLDAGLSDEQAMVLRERLLNLYTGELPEPPKAMAQVEAILPIQPGHERALDAAETLCTVSLMAPRALAVLSTAHERLGNLERAASLLTQELKVARGARRAEVARRLAVLREEVLADPAGAIELLGPLVVADPADDDLRMRFVRLSLTLDRAAEAARQLSRAVQSIKEPKTRVRVSVDLGVLLRRTGELRRARAAFEEALRVAADAPCTLRAAHELVEIYAQAGEWRPMAAALRVVSQLETDIKLRHEAARRLITLCERELGEPEQAVVAWRALSDAEEADEMLRRLEAHAERTGDLRELSEILAKQAERAPDAEQRASLDIRATELMTRVASSRGEAILAWRRVVERHGPVAKALERLIELLEAEQSTLSLAQALELRLGTCRGPERGPFLVRLARLNAVELEDHAAAIGFYGEAVSVDPRERQARAELSKYLAQSAWRSAVVAVLEPILRAEKPSALLVEVLRAKAADCADVAARLGLKAEAFDVALSELGEPSAAFAIATDGLTDAMNNAPAAVVDFINRCRSVKDAIEPRTRARLLTSALGELALDCPERRSAAGLVADALAENGEATKAIELLRRAIAEEPSSPELLGRLDELLAAEASPTERLELYTQALARESSSERRRDLLARMATLLQHNLGSPERAISVWKEVLLLDEGHLGAHQALLSLYTAAGDDRSLLEELERALPFATGDRQKKLLDRLVELSRRCEGPRRALEYSLRSHEAPGDGDEARVLRSEELAKEIEDYDVVEQLQQHQFAVSRTAAEQIEILAKLGDTRLKLDKPERAAAAFSEAGAIAASQALWERAADLFELATEADEADESIAFRLWDACGRCKQIARLERPLGSMLSRGVDEQALVVRLTELAGTALTEESSAAMARLVEAVLDKSSDPVRRRRLQLLRAKALGANPDTWLKASDVYEQLLEGSTAADDELWSSYAQLLASVPVNPRWQSKCRAFYELRVKLANDPVRELVEWARIEQQRFGDQTASRRLFERVLTLDPERLDVWTALVQMRRESGDTAGLQEALGRLAALTDENGRYEVQVERAQLLAGPLGRPEEALDVAESLVLVRPGDPKILVTVSRTLGSEDCRERAAQMLERVATSVDTPEVRGEVLATLIEITADAKDFDEERARWTLLLLDTKGDDFESVLDVALRMAEKIPANAALWDRAEWAARKLSRPTPVIAAYERALEQARQAEEAEEIGRRLVEFHEEWSDDAEQAVPLLERICAASGAEWAFDRLKLAFNASGRWNELFALYDRALERPKDVEYRVEVLREAAMAAKDFASDPDRAIHYFVQLDELAPGDLRVEAAIERLYERQGLTRPLIELLMRQSQQARGDQLHQLRCRIASLWIDIEEPLPAYGVVESMLADRPDAAEAIELLERLVALRISRDSVFPSATTGTEAQEPKGKPFSVRDKVASVLRGYYESVGRTADIVRMLEIEVEHAVDASGRIDRLTRIIRMRLDELDDAPGAFNDLTSLVALEPAVAEHRQLLDQLADLTDNRKRQAQLLADVSAREGASLLGLILRLEAADVYREHVLQLETAIELYGEVLREAQKDAAAPSGASPSSEPRRGAAVEPSGAKRKLNQDSAGPDSLQQKRGLALAAARRLDALLEQAKRHRERVDVLEQLAALEPKPEARRRALLAAAQVSLGTLPEAGRAVRLYRACLADDIDDAQARDGLIDALARTSETFDLIAELEARASRSRDEAAARRDRAQIARLYESPLGRIEDSIVAWRRLRKLHGRDVESFDALAALLTSVEWYEELASLLRTDADVTADKTRSAELRRRLGTLYRERIGDPIEAVRAYVAASDWELAIGVVRELKADRELLRKVCREVFDLGVKRWQEEGGDASSPAALAAAWALSELGLRLRETSAYGDVVKLLLEGSRLPFHRSERRALERDAAYLCSDQLQESKRAIEIFERIFSEDPGDDIALSSVSRYARLLEEVGRHVDVVSLWENQAKVRAQIGDRATAAALWVRAASLSEECLFDVERAIADYKQGADLGLDAALEALARIYTDQREYLLAAHSLERLCAQSTREALGDRALQLSEVYILAMRPEKARTCLESASASALHVGPVRRRLLELYLEAELWEPLAGLYALEAGRATDAKERFRLIDAAARVHVERRGDSAAAVPLLVQAVELMPEDAPLRMRLAEALIASERAEEAAKVLRDQLERYGARRPKERAIVHFALARALLGLNSPEKALEELVLASRIDPAHPGILHLQARLSLEAADYPRAERTYRALLLVLGRHEDADSPSRAEALLDLSLIATKNNDPERALESIESAFEAATESTRESLALERGLRGLERFDLLGRALRDRLERSNDASLNAATLLELARVHAEHQRDLPEVVPELRQRAELVETALTRSAPGDETAWTALGRIYELLNDRAAEARIAERRVQAWLSGDVPIGDPEPIYRLAEMRLKAASSRDEALQLLSRAVSLRPDYERLERLLSTVLKGDADWEPGLQLLEQVARSLGRSDLLARALSWRLKSSAAGVGHFDEAIALARKASDLEALERLLVEASGGGLAQRLPRACRTAAELELAGILASRGEIDRALVLRERAAEFLEPEERRRLLLDIARLAKERLQDDRRAAAIYERIHTEAPGDPAIYQPLLEILRRLSEPERLGAAIARTLSAITDAPTRVALLLEQSRLALGRGDTGAAADQLREVLREDPTQQDAARLLAEILERSGRIGELTLLLMRQFELEQETGDVAAVCSLGLRVAALWERQKRHSEGLSVLSVVLRWQPELADALRAVVRMAEAEGDLAQAAEALEQLMAVPGEPNSAQLIERLIWLREQLGDEAGIERAMLRSFEVNPSDPALCEALVKRFAARGDTGSVEEVLDRAARARPDDLSLALRLAEAYRASFKLEDALAVVEGLLASGAEGPLLHRMRGKILSGLGRHEDALMDLEAGDPTDTEGAEALLEGIRAAGPSAPESWQLQLGLREASLLEQLGSLDEARHLLDELDLQYPNHLPVLGAKARLAANSGDLASAVDAYVGLAEVVEGEELVALVIELAEASEELGVPERARAALERALSADPSQSQLREKLMRIYHSLGAKRELAGLMLDEANACEDPLTRQARLLEVGQLLSGPEGDLVRAEDVLEEARQLGPDNVDVVVLLAQVQAQAGRADDAVALLNDAVTAQRGKRSRAVARIYQEISRIHLDEGILTDAFEALQKAADIEIRNGSLAVSVGKLAIELEERDAAQKAFGRAALMKIVEGEGDAVEGITKHDRAEANFELAKLARGAGDLRKARLLITKTLSDNPAHDQARSLMAEIG